MKYSFSFSRASSLLSCTMYVHKHFSKSIWNYKCSQLQLIYFFVYIALSHFGFFYIYHRFVSLHHSCSSFHLNLMILWHNEWLRCFKIEMFRSQNRLHIIYLYDRTSTLWLNWRKKYKLSFKLREIVVVPFIPLQILCMLFCTVICQLRMTYLIR